MFPPFKICYWISIFKSRNCHQGKIFRDLNSDFKYKMATLFYYTRYLLFCFCIKLKHKLYLMHYIIKKKFQSKQKCMHPIQEIIKKLFLQITWSQHNKYILESSRWFLDRSMDTLLVLNRFYILMGTDLQNKNFTTKIFAVNNSIFSKKLLIK